MPGLGQMISGEGGRGAGFLAGYLGSYAIMYGGIVTVNETNGASGQGATLFGFGGLLTFGIWSIVDAVQVAKVNNMYIRDKRKTSNLKFDFKPSLQSIKISNDNNYALGVSMNIRF